MGYNSSTWAAPSGRDGQTSGQVLTPKNNKFMNPTRLSCSIGRSIKTASTLPASRTVWTARQAGLHSLTVRLKSNKQDV